MAQYSIKECLNFHRLDLRDEWLRVRQPARERRLPAS